MKKIYLLNSFLSIATMFAVGLAFAACSSDPEIDKAIEPVQVVEEEPAVVEPAEPAKPKYIMTVVATRGEDAVTRALSVAGEGEDMSVTSTWEETDEVTVYDATDNTKYGTLNPTEISDDGTEATFMGVLDVLPVEDAVLTLTYSGNDYSSQDGTLAGIDATCNYSVAENVEIAEYEEDADTGNVTIKTTAASFENKQFIAEFTLLTQNRLANVATNDFVITYGDDNKTITVAPTGDATNKLYVAIPDFTGPISLTAKAEGAIEGNIVNYTFSIPEIAEDDFANSTFYTIEVGLKKDVELGDPYYSDGTYAKQNKREDNTATPIGIVVYVNNGADEANGLTADDANAITEKTSDGKWGHALVMALKNTNTDGSIKWANGDGDGYTTTDNVNYNPNTDYRIDPKEHTPTTIIKDFGGKTKTYNITQQANYRKSNGDPNYPATAAIEDYSTIVQAPSSSTGWFLPAAGQWLAAVYGLGGSINPNDWVNGDKTPKNWLAEGKIDNLIKVKEGSTSLIETWNAALAAAAGEGEYDAFKAEENPCNFWSSSEFHAEPTTDGNGKTTYYNGAHRFNLGYNSGNGYSTIKVDWKNRTTVKPYSDLTMYVRPFLAF